MQALLRALRRRQAYRRMFLRAPGELTPDAEVVLADLRKFCFADRTTSMLNPITRSVDPIASAQAEGRREVWMRVVKILHIEQDDRRLMNLPDGD